MANQTIIRITGDNLVTTGDGNDTITTGAGNDTIDAGTGNNYVYAYGGNNQVTTGNGKDYIYALKGDDTIVAGNGDKYIDAGYGNNLITVGHGKDTIIAYHGNDVIRAGDGNNLIHAYDGRNVVTVGNGNNRIYAGRDDDVIQTGNGHNRIEAGDGNDRVTTGAGNDTIIAGCYGNDTIDAGDGNNYVAVHSGSNVVKTGSGNDQIYAGGSYKDFNFIDAGAGNDCISLGCANDTVLIGAGSDTLHAGGGNDRAIVTYGENVSARNYLDGGCGTDTLVLRLSSAELARADVQVDIARYQKHLAQGKSCASFQFDSIDLKVTNWEKLEVQLINEAPVLPATLAFEGREDEPRSFDLLTTATDPNGDALKLVDVQGFAHGSFGFAADGTVTYQGDPNWSGTETLTYKVDDGHGGISTGTATLTIAGVADVPTLELSRKGATIHVDSKLADTDGSETLSLTIGGMPSAVSLDAAEASYDAASGLWTVNPALLGANGADLHLISNLPGGEIPTTLDLSFTATAREADGDMISSSFRLLGSGDNIIYLGALPGANQIIDGGSGFDSLVFSGVVDLDLTALATRTLRSIEKFDMNDPARASTLKLSAVQVADMTDANKLYIAGDATDRVQLTDKADWAQTGVTVLEGTTYNVYHNSLLADSALYVQSNLAML